MEFNGDVGGEDEPNMDVGENSDVVIVDVVGRGVGSGRGDG